MTVWNEPNECSLCGNTGRDIHRRLVEWLRPVPGMRFAHVDICDDREACRGRLATKGEPWPIVDARGAA